VLQEFLGMSENEITQLEAGHVIGTEPAAQGSSSWHHIVGALKLRLEELKQQRVLQDVEPDYRAQLGIG